MKKIIALSLVTLFLLAGSACAKVDVPKAQTTDFTVTMQVGNPIMTVNGVETEIDEEGTAPIVRNNRTLVPVRSVIEAFGGNVLWNGNTREVTLTMESNTIKLTIDSQTAYLNDTAHTLDVAPKTINNRTMLPIRFVAEGFGLDVGWNGNDRIITITKNVGDVDEAPTSAESPTQAETPAPTEIQEENDGMISINITVNGTQFSAKLYDNETTSEWIKQFPATYDMSELNGNEKYRFLDISLPTASRCPDMINTGDIMLYGSNCIVLFYETFSTSYSYTPLGYIENPTDLADTLGSGSANVTFEIS